MHGIFMSNDFVNVVINATDIPQSETETVAKAVAFIICATWAFNIERPTHCQQTLVVSLHLYDCVCFSFWKNILDLSSGQEKRLAQQKRQWL